MEQAKSIIAIMKDIEDIDTNGSVEKVKTMQKIAESHSQRPFYPQAAVLTGKLKALDLLLQANVPIEKDGKGKTPLDYALEENNTGAISILFAHPRTRESVYGPYFRATNEKYKCTADTFNHYCNEAQKAWPLDSYSHTWIKINCNVAHHCDATLVQTLRDNNLLLIPTVSNQDENGKQKDATAFYLATLKALSAPSLQPPTTRISADQLSLAAQSNIVDYYNQNTNHECVDPLQTIVTQCDSQPNNSQVVVLKHKAIAVLINHYRTQYLKSEIGWTDYYCGNNIRDTINIKNNLALHYIPQSNAKFNSDWQLRAKAIALNHRDLVDVLNRHASNHPLEEWSNTLALFREIEFEIKQTPGFLGINASEKLRENLATFLHKACVIFDAGIERIIDEKTANEIYDLLNQYCSTNNISNKILCQLYDYTSADRHIFRPVNPFYWYRQCTKGKPVDDDAPTSSARTSSTQSGQADPANDDKKDK
jgi:hypothetical protein